MSCFDRFVGPAFGNQQGVFITVEFVLINETSPFMVSLLLPVGNEVPKRL
jgi:hypothetical protein